MATAVKDLSLLGSVVEIDKSQDSYGSDKGVLQYIQGTGTVIVEGTTMVTDPAVWAAIDDLEGTPVSMTSVGYTQFDCGGFARVRARNTVVGAGNLVGLGVN
jgi:hypothetical protein